MANDATAVRVAGNTQIYLADVGTAFPDFADDMNDIAQVDWIDLGYVTTEGGDRFLLTPDEANAVRRALKANEPGAASSHDEGGR